MKKIILLFLFLIQPSISQELLQRQIDSIIKMEPIEEDKKKMLLKLLEQHGYRKETKELGYLYSELGKSYYKLKSYDLAEKKFIKSVKIFEKFKETNLIDLNRNRNNLAKIYFESEKNEKQYEVFLQIVNDQGTDKYSCFAVMRCSLFEANKGDYHKSFSRLENYLLRDKDIKNQISIHAYIIGLYGKMYNGIQSKILNKDIETVQYHQKEIEKKMVTIDLDESVLYNMYNNLANVYDAFGKTELALQMYLKVKTFYEKNGNTKNLMDVLNNLGYMYSKMEKFDEASKCFNKVIQNANDVTQIATAYDNMGFFLKNISNEEKVTLLKKAVQTILMKKQYSLPGLNEMVDSGYAQNVLIYLIDLSNQLVELYKEKKDKKILYEAKDLLYRIDELVSWIRYESQEEKSKLFWIKNGVNTYLLATEVCYLLNLPHDGFYFMEKNKALLLQEHISTYEAKLKSKIPKSIIVEENKRYFEKNIWEEKYKQYPKDEKTKKIYLSKLALFNQFMDSIQEKYPTYVKIKKEVEIISLAKVLGKYVSKTNVFVSYITNENKGFGLFCSDHKIHFFEIKNMERVNKNILSLRNKMTQPLLTKEAREDYYELSSSLFKELFPFESINAELLNKRITIVADNQLLQVPFEALHCKKINGFDKDFFLLHNEISYLQSFSLFQQLDKGKRKERKKILAIVPVHFKDLKLPSLLRSKESVNSFKDYSDIDFLLESDAIVENFIKSSDQYEILHFNTHAGLDSITQTPWLAFNDKKITLEEFYGVDNQSDLVVLDACKTSQGELAMGEGIFNLSRGFFYNGSKSVIASLWNVNEKSGNEIIDEFYIQLEKGNTKSKALQLAKIKYFSNHQLSELSPYYWASFTLTGNNDGIVIHKKMNLWGYIAFFVIIVLGVTLFYRRKR